MAARRACQICHPFIFGNVGQTIQPYCLHFLALHNAFVRFEMQKKNKHERSLVLFFHIGPHKYNKRCAALGIQFNSISRRLFVTSRRYHAQYHSSNPPTSISNSRQSDSYHYLDESPISEIPCSQNSKNVVRKLTPCLKKLCILFLSELCQISTNFNNFW